MDSRNYPQPRNTCSGCGVKKMGLIGGRCFWCFSDIAPPQPLPGEVDARQQAEGKAGGSPRRP